MNNYELFTFDNSKSNEINVLRPMNEYKKNINYLYKELEAAKPTNEIPLKFYRDDFLEQDIEVDIDSDKFRQIWKEYENKYNDINNVVNSDVNKVSNSNINTLEKKTYEEDLEDFYIKVKELDNYLLLLGNERKDLDEKKELLELTKKELEQEKELLNIEKEKFEEYKNVENDKLNKDKIKFQNLVEEMKKKIETILN